MKKLLTVFICFIMSLTLFSCGNEKPLENTPILNEENKLIINVYLEGTGSNNTISVYNFSDEDVSLKNYSIGIYNKVYDTPKTKIRLGDQILKSKEVFVLSNTASNAEILANTDLTSDDLKFGGKESIGLMLNDKIVDVVGNFSATAQNTNMRECTLVRKVNHTTATTTFDLYDWIYYGVDNANYLDKFSNSVTPEELLEGPKYNAESPYYNAEFFNEQTRLGGGGFTPITLVSNVDGDTSVFKWNELDYDQIFNRNEGIGKGFKNKARYLDIDTPESFTGGVQEFGIVAKKFTAEIQNNASKMTAQSGLDNGLVENFDRILSYIYADEVMVNYLVIKHGYSKEAFNGKNMFYKDIPFYGYFLNAELYAKKNKLGQYGEKDPYWDYTTNSSKVDKK